MVAVSNPADALLKMLTQNPSPPKAEIDTAKYLGDIEQLFRLSWYERLRALFGRPVRLRGKIGFVAKPTGFVHDLTLELEPIGGNFS